MTNSVNDYEHTMSFKLNKRFFKDVNKASCFSLNTLSQSASGTGDVYRMLLCSSLPDDIYNCVYGEGQSKPAGVLKNPSEVAGWNVLSLQETCPDLHLWINWIEEGNSGFEINVGNNSDIQINLGDSESLVLKGIIVYNVTTNYMLSYARLSSPINVQNFITIPYDSSLGGVNACPSTVSAD